MISTAIAAVVMTRMTTTDDTTVAIMVVLFRSNAELELVLIIKVEVDSELATEFTVMLE